MLSMKEILGINEGLVISTCNRTEIYYSSEKEVDRPILSLVASQKGLPLSHLKAHFQLFDANAAVHHLFHVSLGLESQVLGDIQVFNQVKKAYQTSADLEMTGPFLHRLMHTIFYAHKRVVQETRLQDGNASVASVATELIKRFIEHISYPKITLIGLGEIGQNALENLKTLNASICLINRTQSKAQKLAATNHVHVAKLSDLKEAIIKSDVIMSTVSSQELIINASHLDAKAMHHKLFIDLSVPRSISKQIEALPGIVLYNIDQLAEKSQKNRKTREEAIPDAKRIVHETVEAFNQWKTEMEVSPTINKLKQVLNQIRKKELLRHTSRVSKEEMELLEVVTKNMIQKVIKLPVLQLKAACKRGESKTLIGVLNDLFNLEKGPIEKNSQNQ